MGNVEFIGNELKAWKDSMKLLAQRQTEQMIMTDVLSELAREIIEDLKRNTPIGEPDYKIHLNKDDDPGELQRAWDKDNVNLKIKRTNTGYAVTVVNNTQHASWVNYGRVQNKPGRYVWHIGAKLKRSYVEGQHFLEKTETEFSFKMDSIAQSKIEAWLRTVFDP